MPNGATSMTAPARETSSARASVAAPTAQSLASTSTISGVRPVARTAPSEAGKVKAGTIAAPERPDANKAAESPAVALLQLTQHSSGAPNAASNSASRRSAIGPKLLKRPLA